MMSYNLLIRYNRNNSGRPQSFI